MMHRSVTMSVRPLLVLTLTSLLLSGCAEMHRGFKAIGHGGFSAAPAEEVDLAPVVAPNVKSVRSRKAARPSASDVSAAEPATSTIVASAVPTPRQIFDFHPPGSAPGSFREPFVVDLNDGPLRTEVQHSAKELREYMAAMEVRKKGGEHKRCGETDVATAKPGCGTPATKAATAASRPDTVIQ